MTGRKSGSAVMSLVGCVCSRSTCCLLLGGLWRPFSMARLCSLSLYLVKDFLRFGSGQVFWYGVVSVKGQIACQFTLVFGGLFPMCQILFLLFSYNLVLPDMLVVVCWTDSQDKLAKGTLFWV